MPDVYAGANQVLVKSGDYPNVTLLSAVATGRAIVRHDFTCQGECNPLAPFQAEVVVAKAEEIQNGVVLTAQDSQWGIHLRSGQRVILTLKNEPGRPAWTQLRSDNPVVIIPEQVAAATNDGVRGQFRAGAPGAATVVATAGESSSYFRFVVVA